MLRVVGLQRHTSANEEFVLLQNQGHMRLVLRGHLLVSESAFKGSDLNECVFAFTDSEAIAPGLFVLLSTGSGTPCWSRTRDGAYVYHTHMGRKNPIWLDCECPIHVMAPVHSYIERHTRTEFLVGT